MKAIELDSDMIMKEARRTVDREANFIALDLVIVPRFGTVLSSAERVKSFFISLLIEKTSYPTVWEALKDSSNDALMGYVKGIFDQVLAVYHARDEQKKTLRTALAIVETIGEGMVSYFEEDDPKAFQDAQIRTGHEPMLVQRGDPDLFDEAQQVLIKTIPVGTMEMAVERLLGLGITKTGELVNI